MAEATKEAKDKAKDKGKEILEGAKRGSQDFSALVDERLPELIKLAEMKFDSALEQLLVLEKKTRTGEDMSSTSKVLEAIADICHKAKEYKTLNENIVQLFKRRGIIKESLKRMVKRCISFLDEMGYDDMMALMDTLLSVIDGRIFVEKQRARLVLKLAHIREKEGKISEAAKILQEVQVETFGAMKKKEKTEYILEQMRVCLLKKDFVRTQIISKKIHPKVLQDPAVEFQKLKIRFNELMVQYYAQAHNHIEIAKAYHQIYETPIIRESQDSLLGTLKLVALFVILSEKTNEQSDFLHRLALDVNLLKIPEYHRLVNLFIIKEVLNLSEFKNDFQGEFSALPVFKGKEESDHLWKEIHLRVIEHNLQVVADYYKVITTKRLSQLLHLNENETEKHVSQLVVKGTIYAKIDRPRGVVAFRKTETPNDVLNKWSSDIDSLLSLVENTVHLIQREHMVHKVAVAAD